VSAVRDDDYELMPRQEIDRLRREVAQNDPSGTPEGETLKAAVQRLNANMERLIGILEGANDDMLKLYSDGSMQEQITKMLAQQDELARGIVAVADLVRMLPQNQPPSTPVYAPNPYPPQMDIPPPPR
jgi:hypothetical protein